MEGFPYANLEQLSEILKSAHGQDKQKAEQAIETLKKMDQNPELFKNFTARELRKQEQDDQVRILEGIIDSVYLYNILPQTKKIFQRFLNDVFAETTTLFFGPSLRQRIIDLAKAKLSHADAKHYDCFLNLVYLVLQLTPNFSVIPRWFECLHQDLVAVGKSIIDSVEREIQIMITEDHQQEKADSILFNLQLMGIWILIIDEFIRRLGKDENRVDEIRIIIDKEDIATFMLKTISLQIPTKAQIKECMFSISGIDALDDSLNCLKAATLECFSRFLDFMIETTKEGRKSSLVSMNCNKLYHMFKNQSVEPILKSVLVLLRNNLTDFQACSLTKNFQKCVVTSIAILSKLTAYHELYKLFSEHKHAIIVDVCLPLIASNKEDLRLFFDDPQAFVNMTSDLDEERQDSTSLKLQSIYMLQKMCENLDGVTTAAFSLVRALIDFTLVSNDLSLIEKNYPKLAEFKESGFLTSTQPDTRIETCLLVLAGLNEHITPRPDLLRAIDGLFTRYHEYFLRPDLDSLIKTRICLFLQSYLVHLFKEEENKALYARYLAFLINCAVLNEPKDRAVSEQANQTLYDMLAEKSSVVRMLPFIAEAITEFTNSISTVNNVTFFDVIYDIVRLYCKIISRTPDIVINLVGECVNRGHKELEELSKQKEGFSKLILNKIWNLFKLIAEKQEYLPFRDDYEKTLNSLFTRFLDHEESYFHENALEYVNATTTTAKNVSQLSWEAFKALPKILKYYQDLLAPIFVVLNKVIVYGREVIEKDQDLKSQLVDMGIRASNSSHPDASLGAPNSLVPIYFQLLLQCFGISNQDWERILTICIEKLRKSEKKPAFVKARIGGVFLLAFQRNFDLTQKCLLNHNALEPVLDLLVNNPIIFDSHSYDRKVYVICLSSFLIQQNAHPRIAERLAKILDILVSFLAYIQQIELKREAKCQKEEDNGEASNDEEKEQVPSSSDRQILRNLLKSSVPVNSSQTSIFINENDSQKEDDEDDDNNEDSDDEDVDEDEDEDDEKDGTIYFATEKDEANHYVTQLVSDLKSTDEFTIFRETINKLKQNNPELLDKLVMSLEESKKKLMRDALKSQRVITDAVTGKTKVRKILKKGSRKAVVLN